MASSPISRRATLMAATTLFAVSAAAVPVQGQPGLTFTSGFSGDGFQYPSSIGPSKASGDFGITAGSAFTPVGVEFSYFGANLAFFDANNLLTAPSTLITNDAFWTDPRVFTRQTPSGPFSSSSIGFSIDFPLDYYAFGFNLAIASVAESVPTSLEFQIQFGVGDDAQFINDSIVFDGFNAYTDQVGTFQTLNSPHVGRDTRVEFFIDDLLFGFSEEGDQPDDFDGDFDDDFYPEVMFFDIDTTPLDNDLGISVTQIAMDNFTLDEAFIVEPGPDPTRFNAPDPLSASDPATFSFSGSNPGAVDVSGATGPVSLSAGSGNLSAPGDFQATAYTTTLANASGLNELTLGLGAPLMVAAFSSATFEAASDDPATFALGEAVNVTLTADPAQPGIEPLVVSINAIVDGDLAEALLPLFGEDATDPATVAAAKALGLPVITETQTDSFDGLAAYFLDVSAEDFLVLLDSGEASAEIGTQGGTIVPTLNSDGSAVGARVETWIVTDESGFYGAATSVPEPTTLVLLAGGLASLACRRRHRRVI